MENKAFEYDQNEPFALGEQLKKQLVSEIDVMREVMIVLNMFLGEPLKAGTAVLQELEGTTNTKPDEQTTQS